MAPCRLASTLQSLPPILHIKDQCSVSSYSKGSRGLSVLPRVHCIFTASSISLSLGWRQPGHHYAIRAGRNLPDKEFRYLRTGSQLVSSTDFSSTSKSLHLPSACLLPKLRHHFASFLHPSSLKRLGILYLTTCVGLGYDLMLPDASRLFLEAGHLA